MPRKEVETSLLGRSQRVLGMAAKIAGKELGHRARSGLSSSLDKIARSELATRMGQAAVLVEGLGELKGAAMKAGQMLSLDLGDILPPEATRILSKLHASAHAVDFAVVESVLRQELDVRHLDRLEDLERQAAASASIGQVHRANVDGIPVAVKIQYPGVAESIDTDIAMLERLAGVWLGMTRSRIDAAGVFEELRDILHLEADYVRERAHLDAYRRGLRGDERYVVPQSFPDLSARRVLTMTWEAGVPLATWLEGRPSRSAREGVARSVIELFVREFFHWGLVQTDPNPGNFLVRPVSGQLVLLDFGATLSYDRDFRETYVALMRAIAERDAPAILRQGIDFGLLDARESAETRQAFVDMMTTASEPFDPGRQPFVFGDVDFRKRAQAVGRRFLGMIEYSPPPRQLLFLHRKLGGIFQILRRLDAPIDLSSYLEQMLYGPHHHETEAEPGPPISHPSPTPEACSP